MLERQRIDSGITHLNIGPCEDPAERRLTIMGRLVREASNAKAELLPISLGRLVAV